MTATAVLAQRIASINATAALCETSGAGVDEGMKWVSDLVEQRMKQS